MLFVVNKISFTKFSGFHESYLRFSFHLMVLEFSCNLDLILFIKEFPIPMELIIIKFTVVIVSGFLVEKIPLTTFDVIFPVPIISISVLIKNITVTMSLVIYIIPIIAPTFFELMLSPAMKDAIFKFSFEDISFCGLQVALTIKLSI